MLSNNTKNVFLNYFQKQKVNSKNFKFNNNNYNNYNRKFFASNSREKVLEGAERPDYIKPLLTSKFGIDILHDATLNKGTAFSMSERERLGIRGLVPPCQTSINQQQYRIIKRYREIPTNLAKHSYLNSLQDRNETLFYRVLMENIQEMAPIIYTPTVGEACLLFGEQFRRAKGMYFSAEDKGHMHAMAYNWPADEVDVIVVTDGSRILGLGDLGVHGHAIPIGKLSLYVAAGGIFPHKTLPITIDVGTNNEQFLNDPLYLGLRRPRLTGEEYFEIIDEFISAVTNRWPNVLIQFEDFNFESALPILKKYRNKHTCFNDDIQGTGTVTVAGLLCCMRAQKKEMKELCEQTIVCLGAGSAGLGVVQAITNTMIELGLSEDDAKKRFYLIDKEGLLGIERRKLSNLQRSFARDDLPDGTSLFDVVKNVKPTILLGLSGCGGGFTEEVIREMSNNSSLPVIFPLSNPTSKAECTFEQAVQWTNGKLLFASGSPFSPVQFNGRTFYPNQGNNMYIFPGVGLGAIVSKARTITDKMFYEASKALANSVSDEDIGRGIIYPPITRIRKVSEDVALEVCKTAIESGLSRRPKLPLNNLRELIESETYFPGYAPLVNVHGQHHHHDNHEHHENHVLHHR